MGPIRAARTIGEVAVLELAGDLDVSSAGEVERAVRGLQERVRHLVVDLRGVTFMDSTGLRLLVAADARARTGGRRLSVVRGPESIRRVFRITLLEWRFDLVDDPAQVTGGRDEAV